ncbi:MAG: radical SAM protein [Vicinamibacterales bacterium]
MRYISPSTKVFSHLPRLLDWQRGGAPAPVSLEVDLTARCSLGCRSCHQAHTHSRGPWTNRLRVLPTGYTDVGDQADTTVTRQWLPQAKAAGVQAVVWTGGGEPTLHPDWMAIVDQAHVLGFQQGMYTLGGHLTRESAAHLAARAAWVVVSLDCADAETYAAEKGVGPARFDDACAGVRWLAAANGAVVGVSFLLHAGNWVDAPRMLALAQSLGATYATFRPTIEVSQDRPGHLLGDRAWVQTADARTLLVELAATPGVECDPERFQEWAAWRQHPYATCYGIRLGATITPDSRMWTCVNRRGLPDSLLGDLRTESFMQAWSRHPRQWAVDQSCRAMCRLHPVSRQLADVFAPRVHEAFI